MCSSNDRCSYSIGESVLPVNSGSSAPLQLPERYHLSKRNNRHFRAFKSGAIGEPINYEGAIWERAPGSPVRRPRILRCSGEKASRP